jgi:hypothetical protein
MPLERKIEWKAFLCCTGIIITQKVMSGLDTNCKRKKNMVNITNDKMKLYQALYQMAILLKCMRSNFIPPFSLITSIPSN